MEVLAVIGVLAFFAALITLLVKASRARKKMPALLAQYNGVFSKWKAYSYLNCYAQSRFFMFVSPVVLVGGIIAVIISKSDQALTSILICLASAAVCFLWGFFMNFLRNRNRQAALKKCPEALREGLHKAMMAVGFAISTKISLLFLKTSATLYTLGNNGGGIPDRVWDDRGNMFEVHSADTNGLTLAYNGSLFDVRTASPGHYIDNAGNYYHV